MGKAKFTCTEHFGNKDANELILEPLVSYINKKAGGTVVKLKRKPKHAIRHARTLVKSNMKSK